MATILDHVALNPTNHACDHCEDLDNPVTPQNGFSLLYRATDEIEIEVFLHNSCAETWCRLFGIQLPPSSNGAVQ